MTAPSNDPNIPKRAAEILEQLGMELAFVEPAKDVGLLPINGVVMDSEELTQAGAPSAIAAGLGVIRRWLDEILDGRGKFSGESITNVSAIFGLHVIPTLSLFHREACGLNTPPPRQQRRIILDADKSNI